SFTQIVIIGVTSFTPFMNLKTWERRIVIEDLLDISIFSTMNAVIKKRIKDTADAIISTKALIQTINDKISLHKKYVEESKRNTVQLLEAKERDVANNNTILIQLQGTSANVQRSITELLGSIQDEKPLR